MRGMPLDWLKIKFMEKRYNWLRTPVFKLASAMGYPVPGEPPLQSDTHILRVEAKLDRLLDDVEFLKRRMTSYMGEGAAMTWLPDESPIFVNTGDTQGPLTIINGGRFEDDNIEVLLSYLKPDALCLDIGANLGYFTLKFAQRLRGKGRVMAFEPHPKLRSLISRTLNLNGQLQKVEICPFGLSDQDRDAIFNFDHDHLGSGRIADGPVSGLESVYSNVRRLDDVLPAGTIADIVKIDVEGHEQHVLRGMRRVISESPDIVILLEKLAPHAGNEHEIENCLKECGLSLYAVGPDATLAALTTEEFKAFGGYVLAARPHVRGAVKRTRFKIYPAQLWSTDHYTPIENGAERLEVTKPLGELMFYGPYWLLRKGVWKVTLTGEISGQLNIAINEHFGRPLAHMTFNSMTMEAHIIADHDLVHFECAGFSGSAETKIALESIEFERIA